MKKLTIFLITILTFISCTINREKELLKKDIYSAYENLSETQDDSIVLNKIQVIESFYVSYNYFNEYKISQYKKLIDIRKNSIYNLTKSDSLKKNNLSRLEKLLKIDKKKEKEYKEKIEDHKREIIKNEIQLKNIDNEITINSQKIVLLKIEKLDKLPKDLKVVRFIFNGLYNGKVKNDTMLLIYGKKGELNIINDIGLPNDL